MCHDVWQREEALQRVYREAERKRQERELLKIQEEQERLQRKKVLLFSVFMFRINQYMENIFILTLLK